MENKSDSRSAYSEEQSYVQSKVEAGGMTWFNVEHGYLDGIIRGFRSGFLTELQYRQLCQCESLDDVKLTFEDTDYTGLLANVGKLTPLLIMEKCSEKLVNEVQYVRNQAVGPLATFLDYICMEYMIDNIVFLIDGLIKGSDPEKLLAKCNPLGRFPYMNTVLTFENTDDGLLQLYSTFLVDTPVAKYFERFFIENSDQDGEPLDVINQWKEQKTEMILATLKKFWLEDFYRYCKLCGGETSLVMSELLEFEADRASITIMRNSFGTPLNDAQNRDDRQKLFPSFGKLYPNAINEFVNVEDLDGLGKVLVPYVEYSKIFEETERNGGAGDGGADLEDLLNVARVVKNRFGFDGQFHFGSFYSYIKLKEQEKQNLFWITECINQGIVDNQLLNKWIPIFPQID